MIAVRVKSEDRRLHSSLKRTEARNHSPSAANPDVNCPILRPIIIGA